MTDLASGPFCLILEEIDVETKCVSIAHRINVKNIEFVRCHLDPDATWEDLRQGYELDRIEALEFVEAAGQSLSILSNINHIRSANKMDSIGYDIHTNRELILMKNKLKPLAYFSGSDENDTIILSLKDLFKKYVENGDFVTTEYYTLDKDEIKNRLCRGIYILVYALKSESWRINAFIMVQGTANRIGWNNSFERLVGTLLGYEEWQNEIFIESKKG